MENIFQKNNNENKTISGYRTITLKVRKCNYGSSMHLCCPYIQGLYIGTVRVVIYIAPANLLHFGQKYYSAASQAT